MYSSEVLNVCESHIVTLGLVGLLLGGCHGFSDNSAVPATSQAAATCADPVLIEGATTLTAQTTNNAADSVSGDDPSCVGYATHGGDRVYKVTVPAKNTNKLTLTVTPTDSPGPDAFDLVVYLTENCGATPTCAAGQDVHGGGGAESLSYVNTFGQDQVLYAVVDGYDFQPNGGGYTLAAQFSSP